MLHKYLAKLHISKFFLLGEKNKNAQKPVFDCRSIFWCVLLHSGCNTQFVSCCANILLNLHSCVWATFLTLNKSCWVSAKVYTKVCLGFESHVPYSTYNWVGYREERTEECIPGFILILTNTKSGLFWADEAGYNDHPTLTFNWK